MESSSDVEDEICQISDNNKAQRDDYHRINIIMKLSEKLQKHCIENGLFMFDNRYTTQILLNRFS